MSGTRLFFTLSLLLLSVTAAEFSVVVGHEPVQASAGEDIILPCHLEPPFDVSSLTVHWTLNDVNVHVYRNRKDDGDLQDEHFTGRTSLFHHEMTKGNISLKLTKVTEEDSGLYICYLPRLESQVKRGDVSLTVNPQKDPAGREETGGNNETEDDQKESGDQTGVIVGSVVAVLLVILVFAGIAVCYSRRRRTEKNLGNHRWEHEQIYLEPVP